MPVIKNTASWLLLGQILSLFIPLSLHAEVNLSTIQKKTILFIDHSNGTVTDTRGGRTWQTTETNPKTWKQALIYVQNLELGGFNDWRLPTVEELATLIDNSKSDPAINTVFFPGCRSDAYWSATEYPQNPEFAWYVNFNDGIARNGGFKRRRYYIRAVRGGVSPQRQTRTPALLNEKNKQINTSLPERHRETTKETDFLEPYPIAIGDDDKIIILRHLSIGLNGDIENKN